MALAAFKRSYVLYAATVFASASALVLLGLLTRLAVVPLLVIMAVALTSTKVPILMDQGFWSMAHEARTDWSMTLGTLCLLVVGAGPWSVDASLSSHR